MRIKVLYQPYERCEKTPIHEGYVNAPDLRTAILVILDRIGMYRGSEDILDSEKERGKKYTASEIIDRYIAECNGDGCTFVFSIRNEDTGESIFDDNYSYENDSWEITVNKPL